MCGLRPQRYPYSRDIRAVGAVVKGSGICFLGVVEAMPGWHQGEYGVTQRAGVWCSGADSLMLWDSGASEALPAMSVT